MAPTSGLTCLEPPPPQHHAGALSRIPHAAKMNGKVLILASKLRREWDKRMANPGKKTGIISQVHDGRGGGVEWEESF